VQKKKLAATPRITGLSNHPSANLEMYQVYQYQKEDEQKIQFFHNNFVKVIVKVIVQNKKLAATSLE